MVKIETEFPAKMEKPTNRFEQVDELQPDAITLTLVQRADGQWASVYCPASALPAGALSENLNSGDLAPSVALSGAIKLANELRLAIVVIDRDGIWKKEWGELYRFEDEAPEGEEENA
jgi:hypothetical protein